MTTTKLPPMHDLQSHGRYRREGESIVVEVAVSESRQLFNERDPAPFRERDLDDEFVSYVSSSVQEFPLKMSMKLSIIVTDETEKQARIDVIRNAIRNYFHYESLQAQAMLRKRMRIARLFLLIGLGTLVVCLGISHAISALGDSPAALIAREGFVIVGWVAMWRPIEVFLYDWWPLREQRQYMQKISGMEIAVHCSATSDQEESVHEALNAS